MSFRKALLDTIHSQGHVALKGPSRQGSFIAVEIQKAYGKEGLFNIFILGHGSPIQTANCVWFDVEHFILERFKEFTFWHDDGEIEPQKMTFKDFNKPQDEQDDLVAGYAANGDPIYR